MIIFNPIRHKNTVTRLPAGAVRERGESRAKVDFVRLAGLDVGHNRFGISFASCQRSAWGGARQGDRSAGT